MIDNRTPRTCPTCNGAKRVSRPPHIAGDVQTWLDNGTATYPCQTCGALGYVLVEMPRWQPGMPFRVEVG